MDAGLQGGGLRLDLFGPFTLTDGAGRSLAPKAQKSRALLALLALAPRGERARTWLRDKLWSDRGEEQAGASLRQALVDIKRALGPDHADLLVADKHNVTLRLDRIAVDARRIEQAGLSAFSPAERDRLARHPDLLEGLDVGDAEFEEWLTGERSHWAGLLERVVRAAIEAEAARAEQPARLPVPATVVGEGPHVAPLPSQPAREPAAGTMPDVLRLGLGLLPNIVQGAEPDLVPLADLVVENIAMSAQELLPIDVYDFRDTGTALHTAQHAIGPGADYLLRMRLLQIGGAVTLTIFVYHLTTSRLVWSQSVQSTAAEFADPLGLTLSGFIHQNVDRLAAIIIAAPAEGPAAEIHRGLIARTGFAALNAMYRLDAGTTLETDRLLATAHAETPDSLFQGLLAYNNSFRIGEYLGVFDEVHRREALEHARAAEAATPFNSITLACLGHVRGYVLGDHDSAADLLRKSVEINPSQAFAWDHYALHKLYAGQYDEALAAARRAVHLGSYSPLRYTFETTLCMAATLSGDHRTAIHYGTRALSRQPRFAAAMRYLVVAHAESGQVAEARTLLSRLSEIAPEFSQETLRAQGLSLTDADTRARTVKAFAAAGLKRN